MTNKKLLIILSFLTLVLFSFAHIEYHVLSKRSYKSIRVFDYKSNKNYNFNKVLDDDLCLLVFHSVHCPFNETYASKLDSIYSAHQSDSLQLIYVNSNSAENNKKNTDTLITSFTESHSGFYILDGNRRLEKLFNSVSSQRIKNSTTILCRQTKDGIKTFYSGPVDSSPQQDAGDYKEYLEDAIQEALLGKVTKNSAINTGCRIVNH